MWTKEDSEIIRLYTVLQELFPFNVDKRDSEIIRLYTFLQELFPFNVDERESFIQCSFNNKISFLHNRFIILMPQQAMNFLFAISYPLYISRFKHNIYQKLYPNYLSFPLLLDERVPVCHRKIYTLYKKHIILESNQQCQK